MGAYIMMSTGRRLRHSIIVMVLVTAGIFVAPIPASASIVPGTHRCVATNTVQGVQGVVCVDLYRDGLSMYLYGQALCQTPAGSMRQCAGIRIYGGMSSTSSPRWDYVGDAYCGRFTTPWHHPACPSSARFTAVLSGSKPLMCLDIYQGEMHGGFVLPGSAADVSATATTSGGSGLDC
jgi:hypothetical protein